MEINIFIYQIFYDLWIFQSLIVHAVTFREYTLLWFPVEINAGITTLNRIPQSRIIWTLTHTTW